MRLRNLNDNLHGVIDISVSISIGVVFAALMVIAYIIWTLKVQITPTAPVASNTAAYNTTYRYISGSTGNITAGFDQTIKIIIIAILVAVLAIALSYLMMLRTQ
jgi:hypothetical protein